MASTRDKARRERRSSVQAAHARQELRRQGGQRRRTSRRRSRNRLVAAIAVVGALFVLAVVAILAMTVVSRLRPSGTAGEGAGRTVEEAYATSPYDWSCLELDDHGRLRYVSGGEVLSRVGIDVSEHQGSIDWQAVAADGIDFCYLRAGWRGSSEGNITEDSTFAANFAGAREAGLDIGVYFFSQATTADEAVEEAEFVLDLLGGADLAYPIAFDLEPTGTGEGRADQLNREEQTEVALAFCTRIQEAGYPVIVYGNQHDYARYDIGKLMRYGYWYSEYASVPSSGLDIAIWQYSSSGRVAGINADVDLDIDLTPALSTLR